MKDLKPSEAFWFIIGVIAFVASNSFFIYGFNVGHQKDKQYCGTVIKKSDEEVTIKHGTRTELYLVVDFKEVGVKSINVDADTYFTHDKGANVCFRLSDTDINGKPDETLLDIICMCGFILLVAATTISDLLLCIFIVVEGVFWINKKLDGN